MFDHVAGAARVLPPSPRSLRSRRPHAAAGEHVAGAARVLPPCQRSLRSRRPHAAAGGWLVVAALALPAPAARADQLGELIAAARADNLELREEAARVEEADGLTRIERSSRYPSLVV